MKLRQEVIDLRTGRPHPERNHAGHFVCYKHAAYLSFKQDRALTRQINAEMERVRQIHMVDRLAKQGV